MSIQNFIALLETLIAHVSYMRAQLLTLKYFVYVTCGFGCIAFVLLESPLAFLEILYLCYL